MRFSFVLFVWALAVEPPVADFRNIAPTAGLRLPIPNGGTTSKQFILETTGSGAALVDFNNDGLLDIFLVSGPGSSNRIYRNEGRNRFREVTAVVGLISDGWGQGVCAGDFDNDGFTDLFVTYYGQNRLYRNLRGERFENVTTPARLTQDRVRYNTGCAFLDFDHDGDLDLFVANYLKFDPKNAPKPGDNPYCYYRNVAVSCGPRGLPFDRNLLYRNNGDGTFIDVSQESGIAGPSQNYSLGVLTGDFNGDGFTDIYVACDRTPSLLYINQRNGRFVEEGLFRGVALNANGAALSGMGVAAADFNGDGLIDIFRTNFSDETETMYQALPDGNFDDVTASAGIAENIRYVGWGTGFLDLDNDGWQDLLLVNGHVFPEVDRLKIDITLKQRAILYRNLGSGKLQDISLRGGPAIGQAHSARGAAFGDIDNDGLVDVVVNNQNEVPSLWRQHHRSANHWILIQLIGTRSNRSGIGARVTVQVSGRTQVDEVRSGGSYLSQSDFRLHFGIGRAEKIDQIQVRWPSGQLQTLTAIAPDQVLTIRESGN